MVRLENRFLPFPGFGISPFQMPVTGHLCLFKEFFSRPQVTVYTDRRCTQNRKTNYSADLLRVTRAYDKGLATLMGAEQDSRYLPQQFSRTPRQSIHLPNFKTYNHLAKRLPPGGAYHCLRLVWKRARLSSYRQKAIDRFVFISRLIPGPA